MADRPSEDGSADSPSGPPLNVGNGAQPGPPAFGQEKPSVADEVYNRVLQSDIGISTLLARLKQSIASARDFAGFLHKRAQIEESHATSLKKLCRSTFDGARRPESRQGTYVQNYEALTRAHEKMADNGLSFALSLNQMHEDLLELSREKEAGRKHWKTTGLAAEKRSTDAESAMEKAKSKYHSLAESYHAIKTGDKQAGRFGLKGPKNAQQAEEDTLRKMQGADSDYSQKVQTAQGYRTELITSLRPAAVRALEQLINECDSALTLQVQKFATFNEKLLLSNGLCVSPLDDVPGTQARSMRGIVQSIDNQHDLRAFVTSFSARAGNPPEPAYERHPTQAMGSGPAAPQMVKPAQPAPIQTSAFSQPPGQAPQAQSQPPRMSDTFASPTETRSPQLGSSGSPHLGQFPPTQSSGPPPAGTYYKAPTIQPVNIESPIQMPAQQHVGPPPQYPGQIPQNGSNGQLPLHMPEGPTYSPAQQHPPPERSFGPGPGSGPGPMPGPGAPAMQGYGGPGPVGGAMLGGDSPASSVRRASPTQQFGVTLQDLMDRDSLPVPLVVQQCLQAVDLFGLDVEGIYRVNGNGNHVQKLKEAFDSGSPVDFRIPENFFHDVNSVATLMKQFFRELPDPLLTKQHYRSFIEAARLDDETSRRDQIHATINELPDPNYATLRSLVLHLHRVQEHSSSNRMNAGNLAICFGPTLMVSTNTQNMADAGWQVRVIDTILQHTLQIFDDD